VEGRERQLRKLFFAQNHPGQKADIVPPEGRGTEDLGIAEVPGIGWVEDHRSMECCAGGLSHTEGAGPILNDAQRDPEGPEGLSRRVSAREEDEFGAHPGAFEPPDAFLVGKGRQPPPRRDDEGRRIGLEARPQPGWRL